ncbi:MAG: hypothetical protein ACR2ML_07440 [Solirubrobacteraceae bacterium]
MSRRPIALLLSAGLLAAPASAHASQVEISATAGTESESFLLFKASKGERNRVRVTLGKKTITIVDRGARRLVAKRASGFGGCRQSGRQRVVCPNFGLIVQLRDGNDSLSFSPDKAGTEKSVTDPLALAEVADAEAGELGQFALVDAGSGDDRIVGSKFEDTIDLGPGRNKAFGRAGEDRFILEPDGSPDSVRGDGAPDTIDFRRVKSPVTVDLAAGTATGGGATSRLAGIERVHGGSGADTLLGSARADALYGERGVDRIDGSDGNDLLVGEASFDDVASANELFGGDGNDVIDASNGKPAPTSRVDCGPGSDRETGEVDDRVLGCERAAFRFPFTEFSAARVLFEQTVPITPVARGADGAPTYDVPCPVETCTGTVKLERPPVTGSNAPGEVLGTGSFALSAGQRKNVAVALTPAGQAAIAAGDLIAVRVAGTVTLASGAQPPSFEFGWQQEPLGGP